MVPAAVVMPSIAASPTVAAHDAQNHASSLSVAPQFPQFRAFVIKNFP